MSTNVRKFLVIFDTCDVVYNWFISLLPPIVLDNLFHPHPFWIGSTLQGYPLKMRLSLTVLTFEVGRLL